jgi:hypothetical protein
MNIGIELQVFSLRDEDLNMIEGLDVPFKDCILIPYVFYSIDYITADRTDSRFTTIGSGGEDFTCNERYDVVKKKMSMLNAFGGN